MSGLKLIYSWEMGKDWNVATFNPKLYCGKEVYGVAKIFQNYKMKVHMLFNNNKHGHGIAIIYIRYCQC